MCFSPINIKDDTGNSPYRYVQVPCGKCLECRKARSNSWAFRLEQEDKSSCSSLFTTLTYNDEHLHYADENPTLVKEHLQNFFRAIRKRTRKKLKYYCCGEYGSTTLRPHYHAVMFGITQDDVVDNWKFGTPHFGDVNGASIRYVTNYINKSKGLNPDGVQPEFALMSKGLGKSYLTTEMRTWHEQHYANYVILPNGVRQALPRYYRDKIFTDSDKKYISTLLSMRKHDEELSLHLQGYDYVQLETMRVNTMKAKQESANFKDYLRNFI